MQSSKPTKGGSTPPKASGKARRGRKRKLRQRTVRKQIVAQGPLAGSYLTISECTQNYMKAIASPFGDFSEPPCIPDQISIPSFKFSAVSRGGFSAGTNGVGWISVDPWKLAYNNGGPITNFNWAPVTFTLPTYALPGYNWTVAGGAFNTGVAYANGNSQFTTAALGLNNPVLSQYRLVGCGLRVMYSGTELNRGGRLILYRSRGSQDIGHSGAIGPTDLLQDTSFTQEQVTRSWKYITYVPDSPDLIGYEPYTRYVAALGGADHYTLLAYVDGCTPGSSFQLEVIGLFEIIGSYMPTTASHADPVGMGAVISSVPQIIKDTASGMLSAMTRGTFQALSMMSGPSTGSSSNARRGQLLLKN